METTIETSSETAHETSNRTASVATARLTPFWAVLIVFLSNFCTMVLELVAGRMMAPIVGVSLYTWTSIIGVILAGISLGNYLGGQIADRWASLKVLAMLYFLAAVGSAAILPAIELATPLRNLEVSIIVGVLLIFAAVFLLPATILGTISPVVVKLTLADLSRTGAVVGKIYASGAVGSIAGTFATGFFLISAFGTRLIVWGVVGVLVIIGAIILLRARGPWRYGAAGMVFLFIGATVFAAQQDWLLSRCLKETNYFCIKVRVDDDDKNIRILTLDRLVHSYVDLTDPTRLRYGYERVYADVLAELFPDESSISSLFIGGGGYTFPHYIEVVYPGSRIDVVEIDPGVTAIAYAELGLPHDTTIASTNADARRFISHLPPETKYDLIIGDAFNDFSVPYHLTTLEFDEMVAAHLTEQGIYMVNIIDGRQGDFLRAYVRTVNQVFPYVYVAPVTGEIGSSTRQTYVIIATHRSLDEVMQAATLSQSFITNTELTNYLAAGEAVLLIDDYVPVDNLLAPVFADSGF